MHADPSALWNDLIDRNVCTVQKRCFKVFVFCDLLTYIFMYVKQDLLAFIKLVTMYN